MTLRVSGKNLDIGEALRSQVRSRVATTLAKYFDGNYSGHVTVARDGTGYRTDCVLHLTSGITIEASGAAHDAYASFDQSAGRIENRLRRYKKRLKDRAGGASGAPDGVVGAMADGVDGVEAEASFAYSVIEAPTDEAVEDGEFHPVVIAETTRPLRRLSVSEAVVQLDLTGVPALVFLHAGNGRVNVVYRRADGEIGWIDPPVA
jgi:ribosomal subunit interface protein